MSTENLKSMMVETLTQELQSNHLKSVGILNEIVAENTVLRLQRDDYKARMDDARIRLESLGKVVNPSVLSIRAIAESLRA